MLQNIIVYIILLIVVVKTGIAIGKFFKKNKKNTVDCPGCIRCNNIHTKL